MTRHGTFHRTLARRLGVLTGTLGLSMAAATAVYARGPDFPISLAEVHDRVEARFQELDADRSGEISAEEFAAAPDRREFRSKRHMQDRGALRRGGHDGKRLKRRGEGRRGPSDAQVFERLDQDGDGLLSRDELARLRDARSELTQEEIFAHLDKDGSGGLSREELPDPSRRLAAMDTDGDGLVTREEARQHRHDRQNAPRAEQG